jgi:AcrR family transcriptional regulator
VSKTLKAGRRPGHTISREAILTAARHQFADLGYDRATVRSIAAEAGVDSRLVAHFFGTKQDYPSSNRLSKASKFSRIYFPATQTKQVYASLTSLLDFSNQRLQAAS